MLKPLKPLNSLKPLKPLKPFVRANVLSRTAVSVKHSKSQTSSGSRAPIQTWHFRLDTHCGSPGRPNEYSYSDFGRETENPYGSFFHFEHHFLILRGHVAPIGPDLQILGDLTQGLLFNSP